MGIRVKKVVGYGLTDLAGPEDDRLDPKGYLRVGCDEQEDRWSADGYKEFLEAHGCRPFDQNPKTPLQDMVLWHLQADKASKWDPCDSVVYDNEFGSDNVLVIVPFCMAIRSEGGRWHRYDDIIDYCEETHSYGQQRRVVTLSRGIHPWDCEFEDEGGQRLEMWDVRMRRTNGRFTRSTVPMEVRALCHYLQLFKDPQTVIKEFDPLLYVYWS